MGRQGGSEQGVELNTKMKTRFMDPVPQPRLVPQRSPRLVPRRLAECLPQCFSQRSPQRLLSAVAMLCVLGLLSWIPGCTVLVDANRTQCGKDSDCTSKGAEFAGAVCSEGLCIVDPARPKCAKDADCAANGAPAGAVCLAGFCEVDAQWGCEGAPPNSTHAYKLTMHIQDAVNSMKSLEGVVAQLCRKLDVTCEDPIGAPVTSDAGGGVTLSVESGFAGYVYLTSPKVTPSLYFLTSPVTGDLNLPSVPLASPFAAGQIVASAGGEGASWNRERGLVLLNAFDCQGATAGGLTFSAGTADQSTFSFYLVNNLPTSKGTETDMTGYGGLANVPPGVSTISTTLGPDGRKVSTVSILVRAGHISYSSVTPNAQ